MQHDLNPFSDVMMAQMHKFTEQECSCSEGNKWWRLVALKLPYPQGQAHVVLLGEM